SGRLTHAGRRGRRPPSSAVASRRPDAPSRWRRREGLSESRGYSYTGLEKRRLRLSGSSVHDPDSPLLAIIYVAQERQRVRPRIWRRLRAEERGRFQAHAADLNPAERRLLRDFGRPADHDVASAVQPAV